MYNITVDKLVEFDKIDENVWTRVELIADKLYPKIRQFCSISEWNTCVGYRQICFTMTDYDGYKKECNIPIELVTCSISEFNELIEQEKIKLEQEIKRIRDKVAEEKKAEELKELKRLKNKYEY